MLESTTYPAPRKRLWSRCSRAGKPAGLEAQRATMSSPAFIVAFSPEREDPGNDTVARHDIPKVVGGCGPVAYGAGLSALRLHFQSHGAGQHRRPRRR